MHTAHANSSDGFQHPSAPFRELLADAAHFWEPRRISYNLALIAIVFTWLIATWPAFPAGAHADFAGHLHGTRADGKRLLLRGPISLTSRCRVRLSETCGGGGAGCCGWPE